MTYRLSLRELASPCAFIRLAVIALVTVMLLSACGGSQPTATPEAGEPEAPAATEAADVVEPTAQPVAEQEAEPTEPPAQEPATDTPTEQAVAATSGITVAVNANFKPFLFTDENGNLAGFDIDLMNALSAAGNFEVGYEDRPFEGMIDALAAGEYDAAISAITINDERRVKVDFTAPYFQPGQAPVSFFSSGQGIGVRSDETAITGKDSLTAGTIVGVKRGTTGDDFANALEGVTVVSFDESQNALDALVDGAVDAVVVDIAVITNYIKESQGAVKLVGGPVTEEEYGIAVNKQRPDVLEMLNTALAEIRADGTYDQIFAKWFGSP